MLRFTAARTLLPAFVLLAVAGCAALGDDIELFPEEHEAAESASDDKPLLNRLLPEENQLPETKAETAGTVHGKAEIAAAQPAVPDASPPTGEEQRQLREAEVSRLHLRIKDLESENERLKSAVLGSVTRGKNGRVTQLPPIKISDLQPDPELESDARRDFKRAEELVERGKENEALVSLTDFLRRYPKHSLAPSAQFMIGEIQFARRYFKQALLEYRKTIAFNAGNNPRAAEAGVRAGECHFKLGQREQAVIEWEAVRRRYDGSPAAKRAQELLAGVKS